MAWSASRVGTIRTASPSPKFAGQPQQPQLAVTVEAVAGLDLDRGAAAGDQRDGAGRAADGQQLLVATPRRSWLTVEAMPPPARAISS